ncbi:TetR/AcrR family transcriptional regulator [Oceanobacillus jeddahense]|uniref:TetR/AcrR family transcriptional regulator n=1 Tax=Oceanobacillus jeddahense TaxID=1462527 RepID=UPI0005961E57|nr:TetR/AcrR family transcriptional regulator [Oceanobacillus jeddahense]
MNGYERRTEMKKDRIRFATLELFSLYDTDKISMADIAKKAGVAPATIYNYFGPKEELVKNTIIYFIEKKWDTLKRALESDLSFPKLMEQIIFTRNELEDKIDLDVLNKLISTNPDPEIKSFIDDFYNNRFPNAILKFIEKGREENYIHEKFSNEAVMIYLQTYRDMAHHPELLSNKNTALLKELYTMMLYGLAGKHFNENHDE